MSSFAHVHRLARAATLALSLVAVTGIAGDLRPPAQRGMQEVIVSVRSLDASLANLTEVTGWQVRWRGDVDRALLAAWGLPVSMSARQAVVGNPQHGVGLVRLVEFRGLPKVEIRSSSRPFDTGGIFTIDVFVRDLDTVFSRMQVHGFQGYADPSRYEYRGKSYGGAIVRGQDGIVFSMASRGDGRYDDQAPFTQVSHVFNATQMVADWDASKRFYEEQLGWHYKWGGSPTWQADGGNNFALPNSIVKAGSVKGRAAAYMLDAEADGGTIEIFGFEGIRGDDFSSRAHPPNLGLLMVTIMVPDLSAYLAKIGTKGVTPLAPPRGVDLPPYGKARAAIIVSPGGAWMMLVDRHDETTSR